MSEVLTFPTIDAGAPDVPAPQSTGTSVVVATIKESTLAKFTKSEADLKALAAKYRGVAFDVSTTKGLNEAKAARKEIRDARYLVQNIEKATKDELNGLKRTVQDKAADLIAIIDPVEDHVDGQIKAREEEIERQRQAEEARKQKHLDALATINGYVALGQGKDSAALAKGIAVVEAIDATTFEEFATQAIATKMLTLDKLRAMHQRAVDDERMRAENERLQRVNAALARIHAQAGECIGKPSAFIAERVKLMADTVYSEELGNEVVQAHELALGQLRSMLAAAQQQEDLQRQLDEMRAAQEQRPVVQVYPSATPAQHAFEVAGEPVQAVANAAEARAAEDPRSQEVVQHVARAFAFDRAPAARADDPRQHIVLVVDDADDLQLLRDCLELVKHAGEPFGGRFPTQPKPSPEWWAGLRQRVDRLRPQLAAHLGEEA